MMESTSPTSLFTLRSIYEVTMLKQPDIIPNNLSYKKRTVFLYTLSTYKYYKKNNEIKWYYKPS